MKIQTEVPQSAIDEASKARIRDLERQLKKLTASNEALKRKAAENAARARQLKDAHDTLSVVIEDLAGVLDLGDGW